jgi:hypothetical protein
MSREVPARTIRHGGFESMNHVRSSRASPLSLEHKCGKLVTHLERVYGSVNAFLARS